ncbi:NifU family protein, partial [Campylobacter jejuni]
KSCIKPGGHEKRDYYLVDILAETRAEIDREKLKNTMKSDVAFDEMTVVGQLKAVESVLDAEIRPMLHNDGGDLEVIDIQKAEGAAIDVYIRYLGACSGCSSGSGATLYAIETILQEELSPNIRVMPV